MSFALVSLVLSLVLAAPPEAPAPIVLKAARMLDVVSGKIVAPATVVVRGDRIEQVGGSEISAPADARVVDLGDMTILPGLMDMHVHLTFAIEGDFVNRSVHETAIDSALRGARNARVTLHAGFTTVRNVGSGEFADVALMHAIERGDIEGPWIWPACHALSVTGGHGDETGFAPGILVGDPEHGVADGPEECRKAVRLQAKYGAKVIKCCATAGVLSFEDSVGAQQYTFEELSAIVDEARMLGLKVAAHAHGKEGIRDAVRAGVASIEHGSMIDDECIALMKEHGTYLVPTTYLVDAINREALPPKLRSKADSILPLARKNLRHAIAEHVKIAFGTDAAVYPHGDNAKEFGVLVDLGMAPIDAIRAATTSAADLLGVDDRGVLAPKKLADVIAVGGNPVENIRVLEHVGFVMQGGRVVVEPAQR